MDASNESIEGNRNGPESVLDTLFTTGGGRDLEAATTAGKRSEDVTRDLCEPRLALEYFEHEQSGVPIRTEVPVLENTFENVQPIVKPRSFGIRFPAHWKGRCVVGSEGENSEGAHDDVDPKELDHSENGLLSSGHDCGYERDDPRSDASSRFGFGGTCERCR